MKKENLMGQGLALTLDDNFQEFYSLGERIEDGLPLGTVKRLEEVHLTGSLCKISVTTQSMHQKKRTLLTLEGVDRINVTKELEENELMEFFERNKEDRLKDMKERIENVAKLKANAQLTDTTPDALRA